MAKKKTVRRKRSAAPVKKRRTGRRTKRRGMSEGIAENFDLTNSNSPANFALQGALGGGLAFLVTSKIEDPKQRTVFLLLGVAGGIMMKKPAFAAGVAAVAAYNYLNEKEPISEDYPKDALFFDASLLQEDDEPAVLTASGEPLLLSNGSEAQADTSYYSPYFPATY